MSTSVASVISFFPVAQNGFQTTLATTISSGAATVPLNSVAGYSNGDIAVMVVDPLGAAKQTFTGTVDTSGVQLTSVVWTAGSNTTHLGGVAVVDYTAATHINMVTKGLLTILTQAAAFKPNLAFTTPTLTSPTTQGLWDGWVGANEAWTYASATTITVPSDATTKYSVGDKIKLTQSTVKYFYIVGVASTVLTITGGSSYTLVNAAISANSFSRVGTPLLFPAAFTFTPTGWTGVTADFAGTAIGRFWVDGRRCTFQFSRSTNQTSNGTGLTAPLPITAATVTNMTWYGVTSQNVDNSAAVATAGLAQVASAATTVVLAKDSQPNGWTGSGTKGANFIITYEI